MCRSIKPLFHTEPPAGKQEVYDAALQFVRKVSGYQKPSEVNKVAFNQAVNDIAQATSLLLDALTTKTAVRTKRL